MGGDLCQVSDTLKLASAAVLEITTSASAESVSPNSTTISSGASAIPRKLSTNRCATGRTPANISPSDRVARATT